MKIKLIIIDLIILIITLACSDDIIKLNDPPLIITIDTVYSFIPGEGQFSGQEAEYYPQNIFGKPDKNATNELPSNDKNQILSIGLDGEITIGFKNYLIVDKPGLDFIIFENAFINPVNNKIFAEPAIISVSSDGISFVAFPFDSLTLIGCAGITPTYGNPADYKNCGGDKFDLADIGMNNITHIRIKDISRMTLNNPAHPYYDAVISGFDLDAVVGINFEKKK